MSSRAKQRYFKLTLGPVAAKAFGLPVFTQTGDLLQFGNELTGLLRLNVGFVGIAEAGVDYAEAAKGVTNGDAHDHSGGDGAQIAYGSLSGAPTLGDSASKNVGTAAGTVAAGDHDHSGVYEPANGNIQSHIGSSANPHGVTLAQAVTAGGTTADDIEVTDSSKGLILKAPNGTRYRVTVDNAGALTTTAL